jgi:hypothetical protein
MDEKEFDKLTKKQIADRLEVAEARNLELEETLKSRDALLAQSDEAGWLVTTRNPAYSGVTEGVKFSMGRAFVPDRGPESAMLVKRLVGNFGYTAIPTSAKAAQGSAPEPAETKQSFIDKIATTQMMGGAQ